MTVFNVARRTCLRPVLSCVQWLPAKERPGGQADIYLPLLSASRMSVSTPSTPAKACIATRNYAPAFNRPHLWFSFRREDHFNFRSNWIQNSIKFSLSYTAVPGEAFRFPPLLNFNLIHKVCEYKIFLALYVNPPLAVNCKPLVWKIWILMCKELCSQYTSLS
jgi:hypothetical protein